MQMKEYKGAGWGENMKGGGSVLALLHSPTSSSSCGPFSPPVCVCVLALSVPLWGHLVPFKYVITSCVHSVNMLTALAVGRKDVCVNHCNAHSYGTLDYKSVCVSSVWRLRYWRFQDAHIYHFNE